MRGLVSCRGSSLANVAVGPFFLLLVLCSPLRPVEFLRARIDRFLCRLRLKLHAVETALHLVAKFATRSNLVICGLVLALNGGWAFADAPKVHRALIIYQDSSTLPSAMEIAKGLSSGFGELTGTDMELYTEFLDSGHFPEPAYFDRMADMMAVKYERVPLDVIVTLGPEALRFLLQNRSRVARSASVIFGDMSERSFKRLAPPEDIGGVITVYDIGKTVDLAISLQADAARIVVLSGSAEFDRYWQESARRKLGSEYRGLPVSYISDLTLESFVARASEMPRQTILLILTIFEDAEGRKYRPREAMAKIAAAAGAPSYGVLATYVGSGVVGGHTATYQSIGEEVAHTVVKLLSGDRSASRIVNASNQSVVDWAQFGRWRFDANLLPANVMLVNYTPTVWEQYRLEIVLVAAALLVETLAIAGLLYERRGRRAAEKVAGNRLLEIVHLNQSATAGALSASIAHELNQPLGAIRNNTRAAELVLKSANPDLDLVQQILADIHDDDQRASDIIAGLRSMLKKRGEIESQELDVNEVVASALHILRGEAERRQVDVDFLRPAGPLPVRADRVHLQQVILNIATNAMDAMLEVAERKLIFKTGLADVGQVDVSIADTGTGIPREVLTRIFETFYTTKAGGTGLGLSIARTVVESYGGKIWAENRPEGGAVIRFILPMEQTS